jgi:hypothetical protein
MDQVVYLFEAYQAALIGQVFGVFAGLNSIIADAPAAGFGLQATADAVIVVAPVKPDTRRVGR